MALYSHLEALATCMDPGTQRCQPGALTQPSLGTLPPCTHLIVTFTPAQRDFSLGADITEEELHSSSSPQS